MNKQELQNLLRTLEERFGTVTGDAAEANTVATYTDGVLDCLRWVAGQYRFRDLEQLSNILGFPQSDSRKDN
jgi:hypothetical protein